MKNNLIISFVKLALILLISTNVYSGGNDKDSLIQETLDMVLVDEYKPCSDQSDFDSLGINTATSLMLLSGDAIFAEGDEIIGSNNTRAIVSSYSIKTNEMMYYQTAKTGFKSFLIGEKITSTSSDTGVSSIKEFVNDFIVPCSELIVSIEEDPQQMVFIFADSAAAIKAKIAAQEMMAEIIAEEERAKRLAEFQAKLEAEKAVAARSTAIYQARLQQEQMIKDRQAQLALERELAEFEAQLEADLAKQAADEALEQELAAFEAELAKQLAREEAELAAQEMMAEIEAEMARQAALEAFQQKLADEKAAAAAATAAYRNKVALEAFQQKLADEKAAAAASTAAYQAKVAYEARVDKILQDLVVKLEEVIMPDDYKSILVEELIEEATAKLEAEKFIGAISGEIVTVAIHEFCKDNLNLSDSNIELFKKALAGGYLGNVGPQIDAGTEFTANRWDKYITCVGSKGN